MSRCVSFFERVDITSQQFNILRILRGAGARFQRCRYGSACWDKMSDTSRIVDRFVAKGLVKKVVCKSDKRLVDVSITIKEKNCWRKQTSMNLRWMRYSVHYLRQKQKH